MVSDVPDPAESEFLVIGADAAAGEQADATADEFGQGEQHEAHSVDDGPVANEPTDPATIWTRTDWYACLALTVISLLLVGLHIRAYETLSPIDELQHVDYVIRAGEFDIPRRNEQVGAEAMAEAACRSVDAPGYEGPPCGLDEYDPNDFQENGFNTAASQFPPYYVITGVSARVLTAVGVFDSKVTAARTLGALWAASAWSVVWYLMAVLGIRRSARAVAVALLITTPLIVFHAGATVNADVSLMLCGALAMLATVKFEMGRFRAEWLILTFVGLYFVEATNILAIATCAVYLVVRRGLDTSFSWRVRLAPLLVLPALVFFRLSIADRVHNALFPPAPRERASERLSAAPMFVNHRTDEVSIEKVLAQLESTFTPVRNPYFSPPLRSQLTIAGVQLTNWVLIALMFATAFIVVVSARLTWWARVTVAALLAAGPFYTFYFAYFSNQDFPAPARFALPLVPMIAVVVAAALQSRAAWWAASIVAAVTALNTVMQLVTAQ